jgi:hypothetical protein
VFGQELKSAPAPTESSRHLRAYLLIAALGLAFFAPLVLHPTQVLYSDRSDFLALHLPATCFQVRWWRATGELPLWCPNCFAGRPFAHDLYPLHVPLFVLPESWLPESAIGTVMSWLLVAHIVIAGCGMFAYASAKGLGQVGAFAAGLTYMFGGAWLLHQIAGGHYMPGLAWLPWVLLWLERAIRTGRLFAATVAGIFFALVVLGSHPQFTFYAGIFIALWTLGAVWEDGKAEISVSPSLRLSVLRLVRWLGFGIWTALLGAGLGAINILHTLDFARGSSRAVGITEGAWLQLGRQTLHNLVGPSLQLTPSQGSAWEERGGLGLIVLALAVIAPLLVRSRRVAFQAGVCLALILFALGGAALFQDVPGFNMFRQPARMFVIVALPVAYLVGVSVNALVSDPDIDRDRRQQACFVLATLTVVVGLLVGMWAQVLHGEGFALRLHPYWLSLALTLPAAFWLLARPMRGPALAGAWIVVLLIDLWALTFPYVDVRPMAEIFPVSESVRLLAERADEHARVLDTDVDPDGRDICSPLGRGAPMALWLGLEPLRGYSPLDILRFKEFLNFVGDRDEPLVPLSDDLTFPVLRNFPVENWSLLDLLGTRYLLQPSTDKAPEGWTKLLEDRQARAFDSTTGGIRQLEPYTLYENPRALPRAFVVFEAEALPPPAETLAKLKATDFRRTVLVEGEVAPVGKEAPPRAARLSSYQPNRVVIDVDAGEPGYLVLTDPWFPGWTCTVDDQPAQVLRADYAFRAVPVPAGPCRAVFRFQPASFTWGWRISLATAILAGVILLIAILRASRERERPV